MTFWPGNARIWYYFAWAKFLRLFFFRPVLIALIALSIPSSRVLGPRGLLLANSETPARLRSRLSLFRPGRYAWIFDFQWPACWAVCFLFDTPRRYKSSPSSSSRSCFAILVFINLIEASLHKTSNLRDIGRSYHSDLPRFLNSGLRPSYTAPFYGIHGLW